MFKDMFCFVLKCFKGRKFGFWNLKKDYIYQLLILFYAFGPAVALYSYRKGAESSESRFQPRSPPKSTTRGL